MEWDNIDLNQLQSGDETTWRRVFRRLWPIAYHAALNPHAMLTKEQAEDVAAESLAQLVPKVQNIHNLEELKPLLATMAFRRAISLAREENATKRGRKQTISLDSLQNNKNEDVGYSGLTTDPWPDEELKELGAGLGELLDQLGSLCRRLLLGHAYQRKTSMELAKETGLTPVTVRVRIMRCLQELRENLKHTPELMKQFRDCLR